jgi:uncharacterized protein (AIM24 family)
MRRKFINERKKNMCLIENLQDHVIATTLSTTDSTILSNIKSAIQTGNSLQLKFHGPGKFTALSVTVTRNFSFTKSLNPTDLLHST